MPEENRVFDVAKPGRGQAQATSKPVIVGHHPEISDPMVRDSDQTAPTKIAVQEDYEPTTGMDGHDISVSSPPERFMPDSESESLSSQTSAPAVYDSLPPADPVDPPAAGTASSLSTQSDAAEPDDPKTVEPETPPPGHVEALRPTHMKRRSPLKWLLALLVVALIVVYVLLGTGVISNSLNLPPFKKSSPPAASTPPPATPSQSNQSSLPAGFTQYKLSGTNLTFAAPTTWGSPTSSTDPGYSMRGGTNASDGVHAYVVDFATNKNVELAVTSAKYLPAVRTPVYYDYLQWCTGTADGKFYAASLKYTTAADKTQTATTATCDQGPLTTVTQINSSTIVQLALKDSSGQTAGDLYTKNLNNPALPVIRVKDSAMSNGQAIRQLLNTVQSTASATTDSSAAHSSP